MSSDSLQPTPRFILPATPSLTRTQELRERLGVFSLQDLPPELKNSEADINYTPWRVTIPFFSSALSVSVDCNRVWFVRAPAYDWAIRAAHTAFRNFEEPWRKGWVFADYHTATCIDEGDWAAYWREAKRLEDRCEIVIPSRKDAATTDRDVARAWRTNKPIMFRFGSPKHPTFWSCTIFNPDPDDERCPGSDIISMPWRKSG